jgi:branched-chain amino acid transport system ATP-binding protein
MVAGFSVRENLLLGGQILPRRQVTQHLEDVLNLFPIIEKWLNREATSLSGGQQQLVAIARALMAQARVLMLDEPLTELSPGVAFEVLQSVKALAGQGIAVLLVEQNVHMAMEIADSICVLDSGKVAELDGTAQMEMAGRIERVYLGLDMQ